MNLYEHQSTYNPNMPVRGLIYFAELYSWYIQKNELDVYSTRQISLPSPRYVIFYNGTMDEPERKELRLSGCFNESTERGRPCLEVTAIMLNINIGNNKEIMKKCDKLHQYSAFIHLVRKYLKKYDIKIAIDLAIDEAISNNILKEILLKQRSEVYKMILREYDEELHIKSEKELSKEEGYNEGYDNGYDKAVESMVRSCLGSGESEEMITDKLIKYYGMDEKRAKEYIEVWVR